MRYRFEGLNPSIEENWVPISLELVNLGAGKSSAAKSFDADDAIGQQFAVLTLDR